MNVHASRLWLGAVVGMVALPASASQPPDYDFDWAEVHDVNNPAYSGPDLNGRATGRGSVGYAYRISRLEVTTAQWMEFANAMGALGDPFRIGEGPNLWGARRIGSAPGTFQYELRSEWPNPGMMPVRGISWYNAARYCNWLHNGRELSLDALVTGAYDSTSWRTDPDTGRVFADEHHLPGANYWIPTQDEWMKAAHWSPLRAEADGWWQYANQTDIPPIYDTPANGGDSNAFYQGDDMSVYLLGNYPHMQSYYGLLDLSGGTSEWLEDFATPGFAGVRLSDGTSTDAAAPSEAVDLVYRFSSSAAFEETSRGLRIVSAIPAPGGLTVLGVGVAGLIPSRRRRTCCLERSS